MSGERLVSLLSGLLLISQTWGTAVVAQQVVSPENFSGNVRKAYQAAQDHPGIMSQMFCYCGCDKDGHHSSLLDCFLNDHGSHCGICVSEAMLAGQLADAGKSANFIHKQIDKGYAASYEGAPTPQYLSYQEKWAVVDQQQRAIAAAKAAKAAKAKTIAKSRTTNRSSRSVAAKKPRSKTM